MPRGPLCSPIGLFTAQQDTGRPSLSVGHPVHWAAVVHGVPGLDVNAAQTRAPKPPTCEESGSVGTATSDGIGRATIACSAAVPAASAAASSTSTVPLP